MWFLANATRLCVDRPWTKADIFRGRQYRKIGHKSILWSLKKDHSVWKGEYHGWGDMLMRYVEGRQMDKMSICIYRCWAVIKINGLEPWFGHVLRNWQIQMGLKYKENIKALSQYASRRLYIGPLSLMSCKQIFAVHARLHTWSPVM